MAAVLTVPFTVAERTTSQVLFVGALAIAVPTFITIQRGWTRWLWWRRLQSARRTAEAAPTDAEVQCELGYTASVAGDTEISPAAFERARAIEPGHGDATVGLGHLLAQE